MPICSEVARMKSAFKKKYEYLPDEKVEDLYNCSLMLYLQLSYPFDKDVVELPEDNPRAVYVIRLIMEETLEREGFSSAVAYAENGMSFTFDNAHISSEILNLITPKAKGVVRK